MQPPLATAFPLWGLKHHLQAWRFEHKRKLIPDGAAFTAPDGQRFVVAGRRFFRRIGRKRPVIHIVWQSSCRICAAPYTFNVPFRAASLVRTCEAHRGASGALRRSPLRDAVLGELDAAALLGGASHEAIIARCIARLAPCPVGQRDTRRQRVVRCLQELVDTGALPVGITVTDDSFACN